MIQETSREAYATIQPHIGTAAYRVFSLIVDRDGITAEAIEEALHMKGNTVRPRIRELVEANMVQASGEFGLTKSGRRAIKWVAASA